MEGGSKYSSSARVGSPLKPGVRVLRTGTCSAYFFPPFNFIEKSDRIQIFRASSGKLLLLFSFEHNFSINHEEWKLFDPRHVITHERRP